jgi:hypothetical protein
VLELSTTAVTTRLSRAREALRDQVAALPAPAQVRANVLADLEAWAHELVPVLSGLPSSN